MPTPLHEAIVKLIRARPDCIVKLIDAAPAAHGDPPVLPSEGRLGDRVKEVRVDDASVSQLELIPPSRANDLAIKLTLGTEPPREGYAIVEVQLRADSRKKITWAFTWAAMYARARGGPVWVAVITPHRATERWATALLALAIPPLGRGLVLGPTTLAHVTGARASRRDPDRAILSALIHAGEDGDEALALAIATACSMLHTVDGMVLIEDVILTRLTPAGKVALMALRQKSKPYVWQSDFAKEQQALGIERGLEQGREQQARAGILAVLEERGLSVTRQQKALIDACSDLAQLGRWMRRAVTAETATAVFEMNGHRKARAVRSARRRSPAGRKGK